MSDHSLSRSLSYRSLSCPYSNRATKHSERERERQGEERGGNNYIKAEREDDPGKYYMEIECFCNVTHNVPLISECPVFR
jgi:hypothetical protein